ncbi:hypothetical protein GCM10009760_59480 [Kitasatospora kazusensis]|uniref:Resolvase/invertase-type recombinase catalytic domain-containing protein n=1 Tax=Kitasatospora kazusensis TaxID=407974 RepID=A0ABN3ABJ8_9ACTN
MSPEAVCGAPVFWAVVELELPQAVMARAERERTARNSTGLLGPSTMRSPIPDGAQVLAARRKAGGGRPSGRALPGSVGRPYRRCGSGTTDSNIE